MAPTVALQLYLIAQGVPPEKVEEAARAGPEALYALASEDAEYDLDDEERINAAFQEAKRACQAEIHRQAELLHKQKEVPLTQKEIEGFLLEKGATQDMIDAAELKGFAALERLAEQYDVTGLSDRALVRKVYKERMKTAKLRKREAMLKKFRPLKDAERDRYRLAFDHFDADSSGELDMNEFKMAMMDSGMFPLSFEVQALFEEADEDKSGSVDFNEYCQFIQLYKSNQSRIEWLIETIMDSCTPKPKYLKDPAFRFIRKMEHANLTDAQVEAFATDYRRLRRENLLIPEREIYPVDDDEVLMYSDLQREDPDRSLLDKMVILKLNGGLGASMGLKQAKSLLPVRSDETFLDLVCLQILSLREHLSPHLPLILMNSTFTSQGTMDRLKNRFPQLLRGGVDSKEGVPLRVEMMQGKAPKIAEENLSPVACKNRKLEWYPPGHGELYATLAKSRVLDDLLARGYEYMFVSNVENLGATLDQAILTHFATSGISMLMEVVNRTEADSDLAHLAKKGNRYVLRERAQCPEEDLGRFEDTMAHRFCNTNNLWINLKKLNEKIKESKKIANGHALPLPVVKYHKTVNPRKKDSDKVIQLETQAGDAISAFEDAELILVDRDRFVTVKTTEDLLCIKSDAYEMKQHDHRITLRPELRLNGPPVVQLDERYYKFYDQLNALIPNGAPSLIRCRKLTVIGKWIFAANVILEGEVVLCNHSENVETLKSGTYHTTKIEIKAEGRA